MYILQKFKLSVSANPKCLTLDISWSHILTLPALPVDHGVEITLTCPAKHVKAGGDKATCLDGEIVPTSTPPRCALIRKLQVSSVCSYP
jgi:hypothetical protein